MFRLLALRQSESLNGGQFTLSTQLIILNYHVILFHSFFRNLPLYLNGSIMFDDYTWITIVPLSLTRECPKISVLFGSGADRSRCLFSPLCGECFYYFGRKEEDSTSNFVEAAFWMKRYPEFNA